MAAVRIIYSDDTVAPYTHKSLKETEAKHPGLAHDCRLAFVSDGVSGFQPLQVSSRGTSSTKIISSRLVGRSGWSHAPASSWTNDRSNRRHYGTGARGLGGSYWSGLQTKQLRAGVKGGPCRKRLVKEYKVELCADELVVGGGVGWSYDRRRRRRRRQTGWENTETAHFRLRNDLYCVEWGVKLYSLTRWTGVFSWFYRGQPLRLWYPLGCWRRKVNCMNMHAVHNFTVVTS